VKEKHYWQHNHTRGLKACGKG